MNGFMIWWATGSLMMAVLLLPMADGLVEIGDKHPGVSRPVKWVLIWLCLEGFALLWPLIIGLVIYGALQSRRKP